MCVRPALTRSANSSRFRGEGGGECLQRGQELGLDGVHRREVHRRREHVVRRLPHVHVVVRVHALAGEVRDHLVGVHVRGGAGAGLEDVDRELVVVLAGGHLVARARRCARRCRVEQPELGVHARRLGLDASEPAHHGGRERARRTPGSSRPPSWSPTPRAPAERPSVSFFAVSQGYRRRFRTRFGPEPVHSPRAAGGAGSSVLQSLSVTALIRIDRSWTPAGEGRPKPIRFCSRCGHPAEDPPGRPELRKRVCVALRHGDDPDLPARRAARRVGRVPDPRLRASGERGERGRRALLRQGEGADRARACSTWSRARSATTSSFARRASPPSGPATRS